MSRETEKTAAWRARIEAALEAYLPPPPADDPAGVLREAMRYSLLSGGKRVRPILTMAFCELCGGDAETALPFACAVEMVHAYSLIHDDLPCMDDDELRRGRPTNHRVYGEDMALLAGDALLTKAFETALSFPDPSKAAEAGLLLARLAGDAGMVGGQCIDLRTEGREAELPLLQAMDEGKTAALIDAACRMGCVAAGADTALQSAASRFAHGLGLAFQIRDDVLDVTGDTAALGKQTGMDEARNKRNYVSLLGLERAQALAEDYTAQAVAALDIFPGDTALVRELADGLVRREH